MLSVVLRIAFLWWHNGWNLCSFHRQRNLETPLCLKGCWAKQWRLTSTKQWVAQQGETARAIPWQSQQGEPNSVVSPKPGAKMGVMEGCLAWNHGLKWGGFAVYSLSFFFKKQLKISVPDQQKLVSTPCCLFLLPTWEVQVESIRFPLLWKAEVHDVSSSVEVHLLFFQLLSSPGAPQWSWEGQCWLHSSWSSFPFEWKVNIGLRRKQVL